MQEQGKFRAAIPTHRRYAFAGAPSGLGGVRSGLEKVRAMARRWQLDRVVVRTERAGANSFEERFVPAFVDEGELFFRPAEATQAIPASKRLLDLLCIVLGLPVIVPLMLGIAALIKLVSPGPVFFTQERVGYGERRFRLLKFRSMKVNAETRSHESHTTQLFRSEEPMTKMDEQGDSRLIPLGCFLRSSGLDELPQLFNVLRGEMSIVGPRPCTSYENEVLSPWHKRRFDVLPGLTGLWQVSGKNKTTFRQMINFDIQYARNWSVWMDLKIMLRTFPVLFGQLNEMIEKKRKGTPG